MISDTSEYNYIKAFFFPEVLTTRALYITGTRGRECFRAIVGMANGCYLHGWPTPSDMVKCKYHFKLPV